MLDLTNAARIEANKLHGDGAWLVLLEIRFESVDPIFLCRNTEDIVWNGDTYLAFPFDLDDVKETTDGEIPTVSLKISNVTRAVQTYVEEAGGGVGAIVILRVVHSAHLTSIEAELEEEFTCTNTRLDQDWVTFDLGSGDATQKRLPFRRYLKNFCPFRYRGIECGVPNGAGTTTCDRTLANCRLNGNSARYGGYAAIPQGGIYV